MPVALVSVFHKDGVVEFAEQLLLLGWDIVASGGTAKVLREAEIPVLNVAELVGGKAILGHRVVTLSREIHAGLLSKDTEDDNQQLKSLGIPRIDLVCVDLYPLEEEIKNLESTHVSVVEKTDIGGPTLLRSAAKGGRIVVCDPDDREKVIEWLKDDRPDKEEFIRTLAAKAEKIVAKYCLCSAEYHSTGRLTGFIGKEISRCKYGENPWQKAAGLFSTITKDPLSLENFQLVAGAPPGYVNFCDIDRLLQTLTHIAGVFELNYSEVPLMAVACKHGNPIGAAIGNDPFEVLKKTIDGDPLSIFGGFVITSFAIDAEEAETLSKYNIGGGSRRLLDGVIAPSFSGEAVKILERKKGACKLFENQALRELGVCTLDVAPRFRYVRGGFLKQPNYDFLLDLNDPRITNLDKLTSEQKTNLLLAWAIGSTSNSNTITLVWNLQLIGNGVAQPSRVHACNLAIRRAHISGHSVQDAVAYSDSFFPFSDGPEVLAEAGVKVIFASSGSIMDKKVIERCETLGVILCLYPDKDGRGFFSH